MCVTATERDYAAALIDRLMDLQRSLPENDPTHGIGNLSLADLKDCLLRGRGDDLMEVYPKRTEPMVVHLCAQSILIRILHKAAQRDRSVAMREVTKPDAQGRTLLHCAAGLGYASAVPVRCLARTCISITILT